MTLSFINEIVVKPPVLIDFLTMALALLAFVWSIVALKKRLINASIFYRVLLVSFHLMALAAIAGLVLQPKYSTDENLELSLLIFSSLSTEQEIKSVDYLLISETNNSKDNIKLENIAENKLIHHPQQIILRHPEISKLIVSGDGLERSSWKDFPNIEVDYVIPPLVDGIINPSWNSTLTIGEELVFTGQFQSRSKEHFLAILVDPAGEVVASESIVDGKSFRLLAKPKILGQHQYLLRILDEKKLQVVSEIISVSIIQDKNSRILVLQSSPSFEIKQLQNWASENGSEIVIRSRVSKDIFITRSTNSQLKNKRRLRNINKETFDQFDLIIIDGRELMALNKNVNKDLLLSIENGLGLLVLADQSLVDSSTENWPEILNGFAIKKQTKLTSAVPIIIRQNLSKSLLGEAFVSQLAESIESAAEDSVEASIEDVVRNTTGGTLVAVKKKMLGHVSLSIIKESNQLITRGEKEYFAQIWSEIIARTSRIANQQRIVVDDSQAVLFEKKRLKLCHQASNIDEQKIKLLSQGDLQILSVDSELITIELQKDLFFAHRRCGYFWPLTSNWYKVVIDDSSVASIPVQGDLFIFKTTQWLAHQQKLKIDATLEKQKAYYKTGHAKSYYRSFNNWLFWWMFVLSATLIWLERKYFSVLK